MFNLSAQAGDLNRPAADGDGYRSECEYARVEGRALNSEPGKHWAWLVPWFSGGVPAVIGGPAAAERASFFVVGLLAGAVWQLLFRRDLTSRLTVMSVLVGVGVVATLAAREGFVWDDMDAAGLYAIGILLGLIYTENYLRWRDRAARRSHRSTQRNDAGRADPPGPR